MHDPSVLVFDIKIPRTKSPKGFHRYWHLFDVWHEEPDGRDSGTVCKGMGGSDLTWHNVKWAWRHRQHIEVRCLPYLRVRRWLFDRCADCGRRLLWKEPRHGYMSSNDIYHERCMSYRHWRSKADERLAVLDIVTDVWSIDERTVEMLSEGREAGFVDEAHARNRVWRVFYDLKNAREAKEKANA